jgi:hypothetical protein
MSAIARRQFFDRKTISLDNPDHARMISQLRAFGHRRLVEALHGKRGNEVKSTAYRWAETQDGFKAKGLDRTLIDLGCGESADCYLAEKRGFATYGFDLIEPRDEKSLAAFTNWQKTDIVEEIPLPERSVDIALSSAVVDLIEPNAREQFYREVHRVLKLNGLFANFIQWLAGSGYGFDPKEEHQAALNAGFVMIAARTSGFIVRKEKIPGRVYER